MNESQTILHQIGALRESAATALEAAGAGGVQLLENKVSAGFRENQLLDSSLRQLADPSQPGKAGGIPRQLTGRARRALERGRELLEQLRPIGMRLTRSAALYDDPGAAEVDPLHQLFRETIAVVNVALRLVQAFPDAPSAQLQLCVGLEGILTDVGARVAVLAARVERRCHDAERAELLADCLERLELSRSPRAEPLFDLAEEILEDVRSGQPLNLLAGLARAGEKGASLTKEEERGWIAQLIARHGLNVARVAGRIVRHDPELRERSRDFVLAALVHDVGMLRVPARVVFHPGPLDDQGRRALEAHTLEAPPSLAKTFGDLAALVTEAVVAHHERLDGTGYPSGWRALQVPPLVRLLAVCDTYAARAALRPHRPALNSRDALAETLLQSEQGGLDRERAQRLLTLSFYPAGTLVELNDGAVGVVVATHSGRRDVTAAACPVVALLMDGQRQHLPMPRHLDLTECENRHVARSLSADEGRHLLGSRCPELAA